MNFRKILYASVLLFLSVVCLSSCGEDRSIAYREQTGLDRWMDSLMRVNYYWYTEMPSTKKLNYFTAPAAFLETLIYNSETVSYVTDLTATDYSYGFKYKLYSVSDTTYAAQVLYVLPNSPASEAGLSRGKWITTVEGDSITSKNKTILDEDDALEIGLATYSDGKLVAAGKSSLPATRVVANEPVLYHTTLTQAGKKVGYLVYNNFANGTDDAYNKELIALSNEFSGVSEFILDLRYAQGEGDLENVQLLGSILAPATALGKTCCTLKYNDKQNPQTVTKTFLSSISGGTNLNLEKLYVLVSGETSAAAELLINSLKPYMTVVLVGAKTAGKPYGTTPYVNEAYQWSVNPVTHMYYNANDKADYTSGFAVDYAAAESLSTLATFQEFGNTGELLLSTALKLIE